MKGDDMPAVAFQHQDSQPLASAVTAAMPAGPVLLVDDDPLILMGAAMMLEDVGIEVIEADGGIAALRVLDERPDVVALVTDHSMPDMTGTELARQVLTTRPGIGVVLASGYRDLDLDGLGSGARVTELPKPYVQEELLAALTRVSTG